MRVPNVFKSSRVESSRTESLQSPPSDLSASKQSPLKASHAATNPMQSASEFASLSRSDLETASLSRSDLETASLSRSATRSASKLASLSHAALFGESAASEISNPLFSKAVGQPSVFDSFKTLLSKTIKSLLPQKTPVQTAWQSLVEQYAESPFERELFLLQRNPQEQTITKAWIAGLQSDEDMTRDAALSLLRNVLNYGRLDSAEKVSPHTQMKLLHFSTHLDEGKPALANLYTSLFTMAPKTTAGFLEAIQRDFASFALPQQLSLLTALSQKIATLPFDMDTSAWNQTLRAMVTSFYTQQDHLSHVLLQQLLAKQEKIRLGFLRFQPIEEAYQQAVDETDKRYRTRLRQLKRQRQLLLTQAEEDRQRRIGQIYDDIESPLVSTLTQPDFDLDALLEPTHSA